MVLPIGKAGLTRERWCPKITSPSECVGGGGGLFKLLETFYHQPSCGATDNEAASNSCVKRALICQSQTFVALQGLWLRHNTKSSLGWEVAPKINKAWKRRNYKHSAMKNEEKPSKQSVACSIFNSFAAWHKDGCQTTEETNGGGGDRGMEKRWGSTDVRPSGNFPFTREWDIHAATHQQIHRIYMIKCLKCLGVFSKAYPQTGADLLQGSAAARELLKPVPQSGLLKQTWSTMGTGGTGGSIPPADLPVASVRGWLVARSANTHNNAASARLVLSGFSLVELDLAQIAILNRMTLGTNLSGLPFYSDRFKRKKLKLFL